ncbi:levanase, partial [Streptococcus pneumoniae]|nr:levanase [Streptococcus pneumoniae]
LVALITADGNGQRIKLAYSKDEGRTWTKLDQIAADWTDDPLQSQDFRDPKVFRWEGKWFMVVAGGPLRIYSSDNLRNWKVESTYA